MCFHKVSGGLLTAREGEGSPGTTESDFGALSLAPLETRSDFFFFFFLRIFLLIRLYLLLCNTSQKNNIKVLTWYFPKAIAKWFEMEEKKRISRMLHSIFSIRTCMALFMQHQFTCYENKVAAGAIYKNLYLKNEQLLSQIGSFTSSHMIKQFTQK